MTVTVTERCATMADEAIVADTAWRRTPIGTVAVRWLDALRWQDMAANTIDSYTVMAARLANEYPDRTRPMHPSAVHRWFGRCLNEAGLPPMPMHELRHTAADNLYRTTRDLTAVQMLLGHDSLGTTQAYLHPTRHDLALALQQTETAWAQAITEGVRN